MRPSSNQGVEGKLVESSTTQGLTNRKLADPTADVLGRINCPSSAERSRGRPGMAVRGTQHHDRYSGVRPCRHLQVSRHSLNVTRWGKLNQCKTLRMATYTGARLDARM